MPRHNFVIGYPDFRPHVVWIYALVDPRDGAIRYVGRTENTRARLEHHLAGGKSSRAVLAELHAVQPGDDCDDAEYVVIRALRRRGAPLLNDFSVEVRARHRREGSLRPSCRRATAARLASPELRPVCHVAQTTELAPPAPSPADHSGPVFSDRDSAHTAARAVPKEITPRQLEVLNLIVEAVDRHGAPPTLRELCTLLGCTSTNGANDHLRALERKGYVSVARGRSRGVRVLRRPGARASS